VDLGSISLSFQSRRLTAILQKQLKLESNLSKILPVNCKFIRGFTPLNLTNLTLEYLKFDFTCKIEGNQQTKKTFASTSFIFARPDLLYGIFEKCHSYCALGSPHLKVKNFFRQIHILCHGKYSFLPKNWSNRNTPYPRMQQRVTRVELEPRSHDCDYTVVVKTTI